MSATLAPTWKAVVSWLKPASKLSGSAARMRSSGRFSRYCATLFAPATMFRCESTTPFGLPVLPEV